MTADEMISELKKYPGNWTVKIYHEELQKANPPTPYEIDVVRVSVWDEGEISLILGDDEILN